jgi:hypothetical protein
MATKQNAALEETGASQAPAYEVKHKEQSKSERIRETRRSSVSESGRQHERRKKAAEEEVEEGSLIETQLESGASSVQLARRGRETTRLT